MQIWLIANRGVQNTRIFVKKTAKKADFRPPKLQLNIISGSLLTLERRIPPVDALQHVKNYRVISAP